MWRTFMKPHSLHRAPIVRLMWTVLTLGWAVVVRGEVDVLEPFDTERLPFAAPPAGIVAAESRLPSGFHMTAFASEPDVRQPIAMATDPKGRLWVAENFTYSETGVGYHPQLRDRILLFEDNDNDGRFDRRQVFLDGLQRLTSVEVGLGGVWALVLPNLLFIPDADGDGVPDGPARVILDGFEHETGGHTVANGLRWGPDGWLYGRHGIQSTSHIGIPGSSREERVAMNVGIWRYHPKRRVTEIVAQGTTNPWGMDWDAKGELFFINTVIGHLWHVIPGAHYRRMYGSDPTPNIYEVIEQHADHVHWATGESWTDVRNGVTSGTSAAGGGHAHTGLLIYQGGQWPREWNGKLLTINYHGRRLNVERLERHGSGHVGRHEEDAFFFSDPWFRGIDLIAAPDGGVFLSDWSDAGECHDHDGIHRSSGRIYKIVFGNNQPEPVTDLTQMPDVGLARLQTSANDWEARQARRVLADRAALGVDLSNGRALLAEMVSGHSDENVRLRCLWALHVSGGVGRDLLASRLGGREFERVWALRLLEDARHLDAELAEVLERGFRDRLPDFVRSQTSARVRLEVASLMQKLPTAHRLEIARALMERVEDAGDHNLPLMIWYAIEPLALIDPGYVNLILGGKLGLIQRLGARRLAQEIDHNPSLVDALVDGLRESPNAKARPTVLAGLSEGFAGRRKVQMPSTWEALLDSLDDGMGPDLERQLMGLGALFGEQRAMEGLRQIALDRRARLGDRRAALSRLTDVRSDEMRALCEELIREPSLADVAAAGLGQFDDPGLADVLMGAWIRSAGEVRGAVLNTIVSRPAWAARLLDELQAGNVARTDIGVVHARQIQRLKSETLQSRLAEVWGTLGELNEASRDAALEHWRNRLTPEVLEAADMAAGKTVYAATCGACHKLEGAGGDLGPDLSGSGRHELDYLLENILFPNAVVPAGFRQTVLTLKDGRVVTGIVTDRTGSAVNVAMVGEKLVLNSDEIASEESGETSLMPEGLLEVLAEKEAADLMAYLMRAP